MNGLGASGSAPVVGQVSPFVPVTPKNTQPQKKKKGGLESLVNAVISPFVGFGKAAINTPAMIAADVTGNAKAQQNIQKRVFGTTDSGKIAKQIIGNTVGVGASIAVPEAKAGFLARAGQGAKIGAVAGGANALANDENVGTGVVTGALTGGAGNAVLGKLLRGKTPGVIEKPAGRVRQNISTQGQQMQARGLGISAGNSAKGKDLFPQDTERMLATLKSENIPIRTANSTGREVQNKLDTYGKQIGDYFKKANAPLGDDDTTTIANNFLKSVPTTDERVLREAQVLAADLKKNVKSTKDLWEFRKSLDSRIPDTKQGVTGVTLSNQMRAIKDMRQYISDELGMVPGMKNYHDLSELKPFIMKGMREQNQPYGGVISRVLSSGPIQRAEGVTGTALEKVAGIPQAASAGTNTLKPEVQDIISKLTRNGLTNNLATTGIARAATQPEEPQQPMDMSMTPDQSSLGQLDTTQSLDQSGQQGQMIDQNTLLALIAADPDNATTYLALYNALKPSEASKSLNSTASGVIADTNTGLQSLMELKSKIAQSGANNPILGQLRSKNPFDTEAQNLQASISTAKQIVGKALEGGVLRKEDEAKYAKILPTVGDTDAVAEHKIDELINLISGRLSEYQRNIRGGSGGTDLAALGL